MPRDFWKSAGYALVGRDARGWLTVTPDYLRAYYTRPELHPVEESCAAEHTLFERLMEAPLAPVEQAEIAAIADADAAANWRIALQFRDHLAAHGTIEAAYAALFRGGAVTIPPVFVDQMVHLILRGLLADEADPMVLRMAELFFREQIATIGEDQVMLADAEVVEMRAEARPAIPLARPREAEIEVLTEETAHVWWARSDRFDTAVDFRFTQPPQDALARVMALWIAHFHGVSVRITAMSAIRDAAWAWHVGLDAQATAILNALYAGEEPEAAVLARILALWRLEFEDPAVMMDSVAGKPVYLGSAVNAGGRLAFKPQNLLTNLPLRRD